MRRAPRVAVKGDDAGILIFEFSATGFQLLDEHEDGLEQVQGFKAAYDYRDLVVLRKVDIVFAAGDRADVAWGERPWTRLSGEESRTSSAGGTRT